MAVTEAIPIIDLGPYLAGALGALDRLAKDLHFALTEVSFYFVVNHGVPASLIRDSFRQAERFHAQPLEKKMEVRIDRQHKLQQHNVGYLPMRGDTLRNSVFRRSPRPI
jgi:isopenicillin N synthase-like dioxygenase